jgi:hypothetical protein
VDSGRRFALGATARFLQSLPQPMFERGVKVCLEQASTGSGEPRDDVVVDFAIRIDVALQQQQRLARALTNWKNRLPPPEITGT